MSRRKLLPTSASELLSSSPSLLEESTVLILWLGRSLQHTLWLMVRPASFWRNSW